MSYPEEDRRRRALQAIHDKVAASGKAFVEVWYTDVPALIEGQEDPPGQAHVRFLQLMQGGHIQVQELGRSRFGSDLWAARVMGLTDKGLREIGVLPPDQAYEALLASLEQRIAEIEQDPNTSPEEKEREARRWRTLKGTLGDLVKQVGPRLLVEVLSRGLRGEL